MNAGPAGFRGAALTKGVVLAALSSSIVVQAASRAARRRAPLLLDAFTHAFVFRHPGELLFGAALAYYFRLFERQQGTGRYGAFAVFVSAVGYGLQTVAGSVAHRPSSSGLYPLIFANLVSFVLDVPPLHKFSVFGLTMTDKAFIYLGGLQLLLSSGQRSVTAGVCGVMAGLVYRSDLLGLCSWRLPRMVEDLFAATIGRVLTDGTPPQQVFVTPQQPPTQPPGMPRPSAPTGGYMPPMPEPLPEAVQQLVDMGFDRDRAKNALQQTRNDVQLALQMLL